MKENEMFLTIGENPKWLDDYSAHEFGVTSCWDDVIIGEKKFAHKRWSKSFGSAAIRDQ